MLPTKPPRRVGRILADAGLPNRFDRAAASRAMRDLVGMGLPATASFLLLSLYDVVDVFWLAKLGDAPVAAVTVFSAVFWLLSFANGVIGAGSVAVISRRFGEGDLVGTERAIKNTFLGKVGVGVLFGIPGILILPAGLRLLGASPEVEALAVRYGVLQCATMALPLVSFSVYTAFRGIGRPGLGALMSLVGAMVNLVLDPVLIFGLGPFPKLEILGASIASTLGFLTVTGWGCAALASSKSPVRVRWFGPPHPSLDELAQMVRVGLPSAASNLSIALFGSATVKIISLHGTTAVALFGMSQKLVRFGGTVVAGLGLGSGALIGQYLGAGRLDRAWLCAVMTMRLATATLFAFAAAVFAGAEWISRFFFADAALAASGATYLRILAVGLPFLGISAATEHAYSGAGRTVPPMRLQLLTAWGITIPAMAGLGHAAGLGPKGALAGMAVGQAASAAIAFWMIRRGTWLTHRV
jgi:putative MATE family efflux protein